MVRSQAIPKRSIRAAALAGLGIVYGDLGTSPLYTIQTVSEDTGGHLNPQLAMGVLSLIFWTLIISISIKYCKHPAWAAELEQIG